MARPKKDDATTEASEKSTTGSTRVKRTAASSNRAKKTTTKAAAKKTSTRKKAATKKPAAKAPKLTPYQKAMQNAIPQWLPYAGNKRQLVPILMDYMPSKVDRFVDLFGGTGITGVSAFANGKCDEVIYNDLEYDMVLLLEWMYVTPIDEIVATYNETKERWFGDLDELLLFENDSKEYKKAFKEEHGLKGNESLRGYPGYEPGPHVALWWALLDDYNNNRIILWDREDDANIRKIVNAVDDKEIRRQLNEFLNGVPVDDVKPARNIKLNEEVVPIWKRYETKRLANLREHKARSHEVGEEVNIFAARGDFFKPGDLLFIMLNTFMGLQKWGDLGRTKEDATPKIGKLKTVDEIIPFVEAMKKTPMQFFSHSFTEGWIRKSHLRERTIVSQKLWRNMLESLTSRDIVFIDPPYHGSKASYNKVYNQKLEIYLFAFCQLLTERGIPWILTNNLYYENDIFKTWIKDYYAYKLKPSALKLYSGKQDASNGEVIVSNFKPAATRAIFKEMLTEVPNGNSKRGLITWKANGTREF